MTKLPSNDEITRFDGTVFGTVHSLFEMVRIRIKQADPDPYESEKQDPDPYESEKQDPDLDQSEKQDPDPYQKGLDPQLLYIWRYPEHVKR